MEQAIRNTDDIILWRDYRQGNESAFSELSRRYYRTLVHYGLKFTTDIQLVEDALQDLLIRLWLNRESVGQTESVKFYLLKAFRHQLFRSLRRPFLTVNLTEADHEASPDFSAEDHFIQGESDDLLRKRVEQMLAQLSARQKEVIYLRFFQGLTPEEIAALLSINSQSVSNIIQRAFAKIKKNTSDTSFEALFLYPVVKILFFS